MNRVVKSFVMVIVVILLVNLVALPFLLLGLDWHLVTKIGFSMALGWFIPRYYMTRRDD